MTFPPHLSYPAPSEGLYSCCLSGEVLRCPRRGGWVQVKVSLPRWSVFMFYLLSFFQSDWTILWVYHPCLQLLCSASGPPPSVRVTRRPAAPPPPPRRCSGRRLGSSDFWPDFTLSHYQRWTQLCNTVHTTSILTATLLSTRGCGHGWLLGKMPRWLREKRW